MLRNFSKRNSVSIYKYACRKEFKMGVIDYRANLGWRDLGPGEDSVAYERGRHFAACYSGKIYQGRGIVRYARTALYNAVKLKSIL